MIQNMFRQVEKYNEMVEFAMENDFNVNDVDKLIQSVSNLVDILLHSMEGAKRCKAFWNKDDFFYEEKFYAEVEKHCAQVEKYVYSSDDDDLELEIALDFDNECLELDLDTALDNI